MGCLAEFIFELLFEGLIELVGYGYMKLMTLIVPDKEFTEKIRDKIKKNVTAISAILFLALIIGLLLMPIYSAPALQTVGKILFFSSLTLICIQIVLGILMKIINRNTEKK